jgi:DHA2 family multidrug resistance protein
MRQLGGSFGIAVITTFMSVKTQIHRGILVGKLDVTDPSLQTKIAALKNGFIAKGDAPNIALGKAYQVLDYSVTKQAAVLSYMDVFMFIGVMFLICIPFVLMVRGKKNKQVKMEMH